MKSRGRLDIGLKSHLFLRVADFCTSVLGIKSTNPLIDETTTECLFAFEEELVKAIIYLSENKLTEDGYLIYVDRFVEKISNKKEIYSKLQKDLTCFQTLTDQGSLKYMERLLIQLLGHEEVAP